MNISSIWKRTICALLLGVLVMAGAEAQAAQSQNMYDTPQAAAEALLAATKANNLPELYKVLGAGAKDLIESGDPIADNADRDAFVVAYAAQHNLVSDGTSQVRYRLEIGANNWPFPIPIVSDKNGRWHFDAKAGAEALIDRRIGHNELSAMQVCLAYVDAQQDYFKLNPEQAATPYFAARLASSPGKHDGLYWATKADEPMSPLGPLVASAESAGYKAARRGEPVPYYGYHYQVLTGQGAHASSGAREYMKDGKMSGGFALIAYPARYGVSGVMTFIVNQDGVLYEKNLGKDTDVLAKKITTFDPDSTWTQVDDL